MEVYINSLTYNVLGKLVYPLKNLELLKCWHTFTTSFSIHFTEEFPASLVILNLMGNPCTQLVDYKYVLPC